MMYDDSHRHYANNMCLATYPDVCFVNGMKIFVDCSGSEYEFSESCNFIIV